MVNHRATRAFTLIELLVVVAIIGLLISILLPSLARAKDKARAAVCLSNLRNIGASTAQYAEEDEHHNIFPIHPIMTTSGGKWGKRCVMWFCWGGRGAPEKFLGPGGGFWCNETGPGNGWYAADKRPLTKYMYPQIGREERDVAAFHCPGDRGYPDLPPGTIDDAPPENAERPMYDTVGSSYRGSLAQLAPHGDASPNRFSISVWGQRSDRLENTSQILWGGDPLFYNLIGSDNDGPNAWGEVKRVGWHNIFMTDNEVYADGSARATRAIAKDAEGWIPSADDAAGWGINPGYRDWLTRGPGWQIDCYPTPGVLFGAFPFSQVDMLSWPFRGYTTMKGMQQ